MRYAVGFSYFLFFLPLAIKKKVGQSSMGVLVHSLIYIPSYIILLTHMCGTGEPNPPPHFPPFVYYIIILTDMCGAGEPPIP